MNYGYDKHCKGWKPGRKAELARRLFVELNIGMGWTPGGTQPYIELDSLYPGVRIRKITHLTEQERVALVRKADKIYDEVMR